MNDDDIQLAGMLISIITSNSNTIDDPFGVSLLVSEILLWGNIGVGDCFVRGIGINYRQSLTVSSS